MEAYIFDAIRTVRGRGNAKGALAGVTPTELTTQLLKALQEKHGFNPAYIEDTILGCVTQTGNEGEYRRRPVQQSGYGRPSLRGKS